MCIRRDDFIAPTGIVVPMDTWQHFALQLDYDTDTYQVFYNGTQVISEDFVDGPLTGFSDADIAALADTSHPTAAGTAYFDNYIVYTSNTAVPEPASLALCVIAAAGLMRRIRG